MSNPFEGRKLFTIEQANAALPLVRAIVRDLAELSSEVIERRERVSVLLAGRQRKGGDVYSDELASVEQDLQRDSQLLQEYVDELRALGVEPKNGPEGLVDFPAMLDGRPVYLCWKLDEPEVLHWHELDAGFRGRQPLAAMSTSSESGSGNTDTADNASE